MTDPSSGLWAVIKADWVQISAAVALIVWLVRGEAQTKANGAEIRRLWRQRDEDLRVHKEARDTTNGMLDEVRRDIKTLLSRRD
ncbi:hypothetical protein [Rhodobacter sp. 24-YEA-8]|uniref:hypothetical protein n=1 Tax=Rhodobacter sp. 24-YEA-8 TaxID=1884310 RepID=UPI00089882BD|nr:hypothetical protein [Rhodobacter sp. 24-YEA-8]SEB68309.1 hypothetical protein SAMN05519105_1082 [Rhodobacter sp. 24-YEA-8]